MSNPIKVLFLSANPLDDRPLEFGREVQRIVDAIRGSVGREEVHFTSEWAVKPLDLQNALMRHRPHVVHFSGHGTTGDGILLEDEQGAARPVSGDKLRELFSILKHSIRVVVLNACESLSAAQAIHEVVDYAIGMNAPVSDPGAIAFAEAFYGALASGEPVPEAFALGVHRLRMEDSLDVDIPTLLVREGADGASLPSPDSPSPVPEPPRAGTGGSSSHFRDSVVIGSIFGDGNRNSVINNNMPG